MKNFAIVFTLLIVSALGYLAYAHFSGGAINTFGLPLGGERAKIRTQATRFFENIKFKNLEAINNFARGDQEDIEKFFKKTFGTDPDEIDLRSFKVNSIELDSSNMRARVRMEFSGIDLDDNKPFNKSRIVFLYFDPKIDNWLIDVKNISN